MHACKTFIALVIGGLRVRVGEVGSFAFVCLDETDIQRHLIGAQRLVDPVTRVT